MTKGSLWLCGCCCISTWRRNSPWRKVGVFRVGWGMIRAPGTWKLVKTEESWIHAGAGGLHLQRSLRAQQDYIPAQGASLNSVVKIKLRHHTLPMSCNPIPRIDIF